MPDLVDQVKKAGNAVLDAGENFHRQEMRTNSRGRVTTLTVTKVTDQFGRSAWAVKKNGVIFDDAFPTKNAAVTVAQGLADDFAPAKLVVEYANGRVQDRKYYG